MTSKSLCFKLMKEDFKRRVWATALTILGFLFTILIPTAIKCSEFIEKSGIWGPSTRRRMAANIVELLGVNGMAVAFLVGAGVLWAVSGFHYLHNSRKVDFYHSIPVKRRTLFLAVYVNGLLVPAAIYAAMLAPSVALAVRAVGIQAVRTIPLQSYVLNMVYYSMLYTTAVIAMMMTGNVVVALLGNCIFWAYGPAMTGLVRAYYGWFHTYYETEARAKAFLRVLKYSSPFANYMFSLVELSERNFPGASLAGAAVVTAALAILAYSLYRIRASEAAGKAMAFRKTETPIKVLLVVPIAVAFGMLFYLIRQRVFWLVFGAAFGVLLSHCLMEIIYHFDFRKLFSHRIHLGACMAVAVGLSLAGYYDWYGYDSWLPEASKVSDFAVCIQYKDNWVTYGAPARKQQINDETGMEEDRYYWNYKSGQEYIFQNMELTDAYSVMQLAKRGVWADDMLRKGDSVVCDYWERCIILFRMKNGKTAIRTYSIPLDEATREVRDIIHDSAEYKRGNYPLLKQTAAQTAQVNFQQYNRVQAVDLKQDEIGQLLNAYQKEMEGLTMDTRNKELPIGTIQFMTTEHKNAYEYEQESTSRYYALEERCYYPVYPSFAHTLEILKKAGVSFMEIGQDTVETISIFYEEPYGRAMEEQDFSYMDTSIEHTIEYTKAEDIAALAPALYFQDYYNMNSYYDDYEADSANLAEVTVTLAQEPAGKAPYRKTSYGSKEEYTFYLDKKKMSQEELARYRLDKDLED